MSNNAYGEYGLPQTPMAKWPWLLASTAFAALTYLAACMWATQSFAERLHYQESLGAPFLSWGQRPLYAPWSIFRWRARLDQSLAAQQLAGLTDGRLELGALVAVLGGVALCLIALKRRRNRISDVMGGARFATLKEIEKDQLLRPEGIILGGVVDPATRAVRWLRSNGFNHAAAFGPTSSGKGIALVIPTALTWRHSMVVHDPKGENFAKTSGFRATIGPVYRMDFGAESARTAGFNPLDFVRVDSIYEAADAQRLAREVVDPDGEQFRSKNKHWVEGAASLIAGAVLHLLYKHALNKLPPPGLYDLLLELTVESNIEAWKEFPHDADFMRQWVVRGEECSTHPFVLNAAEEYLNRRGDEKASILSAAVTPLSLFRDPVLRANTSYSSFAMDELMDGDQPVSVYLVNRPEDEHRIRPLIRIFLGMMIGRLTPPMEFDQPATLALAPGKGSTKSEGQSTLVGTLSRARKCLGFGSSAPSSARQGSASQHKHRMVLLIDEFPMLGRMPIITKALAWMRGWGLTAYLLAQDYMQLTAEYGKDETITGACEYVSALRPNNLQTAEMLSKRLGRTTVTLVMPPSKFGGRSTYSQVARDLLSPDEVMRLEKAEKRDDKVVRGGDMLIFGGDRPIFGRQPLYFEDRTLLHRSQLPPVASFPAGSPRPPALDLITAPSEEALIQQTIGELAARIAAGEAAYNAASSNVDAANEPTADDYESLDDDYA